MLVIIVIIMIIMIIKIICVFYNARTKKKGTQQPIKRICSVYEQTQYSLFYYVTSFSYVRVLPSKMKYAHVRRSKMLFYLHPHRASQIKCRRERKKWRRAARESEQTEEGEEKKSVRSICLVDQISTIQVFTTIEDRSAAAVPATLT